MRASELSGAAATTQTRARFGDRYHRRRRIAAVFARRGGHLDDFAVDWRPQRCQCFTLLHVYTEEAEASRDVVLRRTGLLQGRNRHGLFGIRCQDLFLRDGPIGEQIRTRLVSASAFANAASRCLTSACEWRHADCSSEMSGVSSVTST